MSAPTAASSATARSTMPRPPPHQSTSTASASPPFLPRRVRGHQREDESDFRLSLPSRLRRSRRTYNLDCRFAAVHYVYP
ncbi:unnamed protein product [Linum trigynum]|uniref:Uncharacterized protein n=1 Tax=Linum trigynum TaxID=586398 RepID=A0AAV2FF58_9ROSI